MSPTEPIDGGHEPGQGGLRRLTLVTCFAFSAIGVALIVSADSGAHTTGLLSLVFFGGLGLVYWGLAAPRQRGGAWDVGSADEERVWYPISRAKAALRSAGAGIFVLVGGAVMFAPTLASGVFPPIPVIIVFGVCVLYFGMVLVVLAVPSVIRPGGILLTPYGIAYHSGLDGFRARWSDIEQVRMARSGLLGFRAAEDRLLDVRGLQRLLSPVSAAPLGRPRRDSVTDLVHRLRCSQGGEEETPQSRGLIIEPGASRIWMISLLSEGSHSSTAASGRGEVLPALVHC